MSTLNGMKYLVFKHDLGSEERIYLFQAEEKHSDFAARMIKGDPYWKPVRGGFAWFMLQDADGNTLEGKFKCYGESFSLGLQSDPEKDTMLLYRELVKE